MSTLSTKAIDSRAVYGTTTHSDSLESSGHLVMFERVALQCRPHLCYILRKYLLTLKVLVATIDAQWEGMGDVGLARYEYEVRGKGFKLQ